MKQALYTFLAVSLLVGTVRAQVTINSSTTLLIDQREPGPIQKAANDLATDMQAVLGSRVRIVHQAADASGTTICISYLYNPLASVTHPTGWETFRIQAVADPWPGSPNHDAIVLTGSDVLGTVYAIYQFSQQFLGVDPLYWWTDHAPAHRSNIVIPGNFHEVVGPPTFKYRGWFINDDDLLTGWRPGIDDGTGISLKAWDHIFEALLRLRGNMIIPGTFIFPYEPQIRAASDRGLYISQHHVETLGLDTYHWPKDKPYSFTKYPELLTSAWTCAVNQYPKSAQLIWTLGYRGENDRPFWDNDKSAPTSDEARAKVIQDAINAQIRIVKLNRRDSNPPFIFNAWDEGSEFIRKGLLQLPSGATLVWADDGQGIILDRGKISAGQGVYYHVAMFNGRSNHFSELIPLERIRHELGRAATARATNYLIVNTANVRPVVMTTRATMELAWDAKPWMDGSHDEAAAYLDRWSREEFGEKAAGAIDKYYRAYFQAPARFQAPASYGTTSDDLMGDNFYQSMTRRILIQLSKGNNALRQPGAETNPNATRSVPDFAKKCESALPRWENAMRLAETARRLVPQDRQQFFQASILTQVGANLHGNRMLLDVYKAAEATSTADRLRLIHSALGENEAVEKALTAADYGKWTGYYKNGDWLLDVQLTINLEKAYIRQLEGHGMDENTMVRSQDGGFAYHMITAYQGTQQTQFCFR